MFAIFEINKQNNQTPQRLQITFFYFLLVVQNINSKFNTQQNVYNKKVHKLKHFDGYKQRKEMPKQMEFSLSRDLDHFHGTNKFSFPFQNQRINIFFHQTIIIVCFYTNP